MAYGRGGGAAPSATTAYSLLAPVGRWMAPPGTLGSGSPTTNGLAATPLFVPKKMTIDQLGLNVSVAGTAGALFRMGIYDDNDGKPNNLLLDAGQVDATTTGSKIVTGLSLVLNPGVIWLAVASQPQNGAQFRAAYGGQGWSGLVAGPAAVNAGGLLSGTSVPGALPAAFGAISAEGIAPLLYLHRSA